jgi:hypothetical protein
LRSFGAIEQQHAVVLFRLAELPLPEERVGVGLDILPVERGDGGDDELDSRFRLEIGELLLDRRACSGGDDGGLIDDASVRAGKAAKAAARNATTSAAASAATPAGRPTRFMRALCSEAHLRRRLRAPSVAANSAIGFVPEKKVLAHSTDGKVRSVVLYSRTASM